MVFREARVLMAGTMEEVLESCFNLYEYAVQCDDDISPSSVVGGNRVIPQENCLPEEKSSEF